MLELTLIKTITFILVLVTLTRVIYIGLKYHLIALKNSKNIVILGTITGLIANFFDAIGIGSFATVVAFNRFFKLIDYIDLPGTLNTQAVLPAFIESLFFLTAIKINILLLITAILAVSLGSILGSYCITRLNKQHILLTMTIAFFFMAIILLCNQLHLLPIGGEKTMIHGIKFIFLTILMIFIGMLPAAGIGFYAPMQIALFLFGFSPLIAYPLMATASAVQQPIIVMAFLRSRRLAILPGLIIGFAGAIGVLIAVSLITHLHFTWLRWLLLVIILYNAVTMLCTYLKSRNNN